MNDIKETRRAKLERIQEEIIKKFIDESLYPGEIAFITDQLKDFSRFLLVRRFEEMVGLHEKN